MIGVALSEWGYSVRVAHDGPTALHLVDSFAPQLALLDIGLPKMDGYELARRLRERPGFDSLRFVARPGTDETATSGAPARRGSRPIFSSRSIWTSSRRPS